MVLAVGQIKKCFVTQDPNKSSKLSHVRTWNELFWYFYWENNLEVVN